VSETVELNGVSLDCLRKPASDTWKSVFAAACPAPFSGLAENVEVSTLHTAFSDWGLTEALILEIPTISSDWDTLNMDVESEILGQGELLITPLHMANVAAVLGNDGQQVNLHLLMQPFPGCGEFSTPAPDTEVAQVIDPDTAAALRAMLPSHGKVIGHNATALAGPNRIQSWYIGLNSIDVPRYAVAVLIESDVPSPKAAQIGSDLLNLATGMLEP
jgi:peptidoglycan glycosyltransferase